MKIFKRILLGLLFFVVLIVVVGFFLLNNLKNGAIPDYNKNLKITGLTEEVTVLRDAHGIPHLKAQNEEDLYRAIGFTMAQDRLWQMDLLRRVTQGRLSEILGKEQVNTDLLCARFEFKKNLKKFLPGQLPKLFWHLKPFPMA